MRLSSVRYLDGPEGGTTSLTGGAAFCRRSALRPLRHLRPVLLSMPMIRHACALVWPCSMSREHASRSRLSFTGPWAVRTSRISIQCIP